MIVSRRWLEALLERTLDARDVADRLTLHAAAVDAVVPLHQDLNDILIARVLEVKKHPDADRLSLCSAKELGLGADHAGILELDTTAAPGTRFIDAMGIADHQIVIDVPANRPDLLCHKGVARELGASIAAPVKLPPIPGAN